MKPIILSDYDESWPDLFDAESKRLEAALDGLAVRIDHVGSTAIPGLAAKPVIDIQISVEDEQSVEHCRRALVEIGYTYTLEPFPYFHRPGGWPHTHHVHVRAAGSVDEQRTLAFRDWLRAHPDDRQSYERLKRELAVGSDANSVAGRFRYSEAKTDFIRNIERRSRRD